mmetsp:Transcript_14472/g.34271  ORF Transcript_14472/g.34271 Transcript_14472/m.34271 type:complete len:223 (-) Transcript_14472:3257-3925(-)
MRASDCLKPSMRSSSTLASVSFAFSSSLRLLIFSSDFVLRSSYLALLSSRSFCSFASSSLRIDWSLDFMSVSSVSFEASRSFTTASRSSRSFCRFEICLSSSALVVLWSLSATRRSFSWRFTSWRSASSSVEASLCRSSISRDRSFFSASSFSIWMVLFCVRSWILISFDSSAFFMSASSISFLAWVAERSFSNCLIRTSVSDLSVLSSVVYLVSISLRSCL